MVWIQRLSGLGVSASQQRFVRWAAEDGGRLRFGTYSVLI